MTPKSGRRGRAAALAAGCALLLVPLARGFAQTPAEYHARADRALQSFLLKFWSQGLDYLGAQYPGNGQPTGYWTFAQGFDALLDGVERTGGARYAGLIRTFYDAAGAKGWQVGYYDDESWMALALLRAYDLTGESDYLNTALSLFQDIEGGWDTTCCGAQKGGIWWDKSHTQKATASNAGPAILGARLYERTRVSAHLDFAKKVYAYWYANMVDRSTFQVTDHIQPDGTKVGWKFTYNEGLMIGASVELHRITGEAQYLTNAKNIAGFVLASEVAATVFGNVLSDGTNTSCGGDCHAFKGPAFRYLLLLYQATGTTAYWNVLKASANAIWNLARNAAEDLFSVSWAGPAMSSFSEPQAAAAVMALNLFAAANGPYPGTGAAASQYEAEDAAITGVGLEASHAGFTGWGYVAGWQGDGERVDFTVHAPAAGSYQVSFRYAGGAGDSSRLIALNGTPIQANLRFPGTGAWSSYGAIVVEAVLPAGKNVLSVIYQSASGSRNFLNLDHLSLRSFVPLFVRGDPNGDGALDLADAVAILLSLFSGQSVVTCDQTADADGNGRVDGTDAVFVLEYLFRNGPAPGSPYPGCGPGVAGALGCVAYTPCEW